MTVDGYQLKLPRNVVSFIGWISHLLESSSLSPHSSPQALSARLGEERWTTPPQRNPSRRATFRVQMQHQRLSLRGTVPLMPSLDPSQLATPLLVTVSKAFKLAPAARKVPSLTLHCGSSCDIHSPTTDAKADTDATSREVNDLSGPCLTPVDKGRLETVAVFPSPPPSGTASRSKGPGLVRGESSLRVRASSPVTLGQHRAVTSDSNASSALSVCHLS